MPGTIGAGLAWRGWAWRGRAWLGLAWQAWAVFDRETKECILSAMVTKTLRRFIPAYGGKRSIATKYPAPRYETIMEPFAGGAGYSLQYPTHEVHLRDLDERVVGVWQYLIHASAAEVLSIPLVTDTTDLPDHYGQEVRWLVGWWLAPAAAGGPAIRAYSWGGQHEGRSDVWSEKCRARLASQLDAIRHWTVELGNYEDLVPTAPATWFIDPPYQKMGVHYKKSSRSLNYPSLAQWCRELPGQVIVCENEGADWLPFEELCSMTGGATKRTRTEVLWTN